VPEALHHLALMYEYGLVQAFDDESPAEGTSPRRFKPNNR
jgi:hypothetical protein